MPGKSARPARYACGKRPVAETGKLSARVSVVSKLNQAYDLTGLEMG